MPRAWRLKGSRASKGSRFDGAEPVFAERRISSLIQTQGVGDLYRIYLTAQWDGGDYHLAYIPRRFNVPHREDLDTEYMRRLFEVGDGMAAKGYPWEKDPPKYIPSSEAAPREEER
ncbi:MAG: hypothetical protein M3461_07205 [Pseudomonadota bacterium]|nr:hypothetical protein [Pseudomonadota bacterium]